ncbi:hypothetical protein [Nocardiopsis alba]|uniref:hypothetical protein n=1 Tax=Nocardiopsis alba TaxID=53437 RepID=UPI0033A3CC7D
MRDAELLHGDMSGGDMLPAHEWAEIREEVLEAHAAGRLVDTIRGEDGSVAYITAYDSPRTDPPEERFVVEWQAVEDSELWEAVTMEAARRVAEKLTDNPAPEESEEYDDRDYDDEDELILNANEGGAPDEDV